MPPPAKPDFDFESRLVPLLLAFAQAKGLPVASLIERLGLPTSLARGSNGRELVITRVSAVVALGDALAEALHDEHVGLTMVDWVPRGSFGVAEFVVRSSTTLALAFEHFLRFNALIAPSQTFTLEVVDGEARLHNAVTLRAGALERKLGEFVTAITAQVLRTVAPGVPVTRVWFATPRPNSLERLVATFGEVPFSFEQSTNGFAVAAQALETKVTGGDPALNAFLEDHANAALASRPKQDDLIDKLRHALREALGQGEPHIERLAMRLNLSARTLQRRLAELQTSFQQVLDEVRFDLARAYLRDVRLDVSQVAYLLGYSELRAFDRAFRRWAGQSPTEWRASAG